MIAIIAKNRPVDPLRKTTLIVAPLALLDQWQLEIKMKTTLDFKILIYHGTSYIDYDRHALIYHLWKRTIQTTLPRTAAQVRRHTNNLSCKPVSCDGADLFSTYSQTLAFEWPDDEAAERTEKAKKKKQKKDDDFIEDDMQQDKKRKPRKNLGLLFQVDVSYAAILPIHAPDAIFSSGSGSFLTRRSAFVIGEHVSSLRSFVG